MASPFLLDDLRLGQTKSGKPYVGLKIKDRTGEMEARVWNGADSFWDLFSAGEVAFVEGVADSYQNQVQLKVVAARPIPPDQVDPSFFLPASPFDPDEMMAELLSIVHSMGNPHLRDLVDDILTDPEFMPIFKRAPAAKRFHHAYVAGLLEHTLSVTRTAATLAPLYPVLNRDLLLTGAVLHDLGKVYEFGQDMSGDYTDEGRLLGHLIIGLDMIEKKLSNHPEFPPELALLVKHLIISHHGEYEMGSPKKPKIMEALALHHIDDLDAKMNAIGGFIDRHADERSGWTDYNRLMARFFYKPNLTEYPPVEQPDFQVESPGEAVSEEDQVRNKTRKKPDTNQLSLLDE